ncbi:MAG TPA: FKBP-type peptidyl-prolyl cis-trans isomerase [Steroidobacteraceae bacterium]|nr:FKBP-type peptidyl-prolyl cis-trans isomerase [Steroidobacteraceae bacterium]
MGTIILLAGALPAQAQTGGNTGPSKTIPASSGAKPKAAAAADSKSAASYSIGVSVGTQLHGYGLTADTVSFDRVVQGLRDALAGKAVAGTEDGQRVQALIEQTRETIGSTNKAAAEKFLATNAKQPGVVTTATGLQYKIVRPGTGESPKSTDQVTVNYRGTLLDGTEFDSSYKRNQPFTTGLNGIIKGWSEALMLMKVGEKVELYIPPDLGYGQNSPPPLPPNALLKFEVELLSVKAGGAAAPPAGPAMSGPRHP